MRRNGIIAALLVASVVLAGGVFAVTSTPFGQTPPTVQQFEVVETQCDDSSYDSAIEQRPADGGTTVAVEDAVVGPSPDRTLGASVERRGGRFVLTLAPRATETTGTTDVGYACAGELHYRAVIFLPAEDFELAVVHGDETHTVVHSGEDGSSASSDSSGGSDSSDSSGGLDSSEDSDSSSGSSAG